MFKATCAAVVTAAVLLAGCKMDGVAAPRSPGRDGALARAPRYEDGRDFVLTGVVEADYNDYLVLRSGSGHVRFIRIQDSTRYYLEGRLQAREYLAAGSRVRASFNLNHRDMVATEIYVLEDAGGPDPIVWPDRVAPVP